MGDATVAVTTTTIGSTPAAFSAGSTILSDSEEAGWDLDDA